jgi:uncharacterized protein (TIRG00374 family)
MTGPGHQQRPDSGGSGNGAPHVASTRTIALGVLLVVVLAVGLVLLLGKAAGYREVLDALEGADASWLIGCLFLEAAAYAGYVVCMRAIIAQDDGVTLSGMNATRMWLASLGATRIVSPAGAGGLAIIYWLLRRAGLAVRDAASRVLGFNILIFALFGMWAFATSLVILVGFGQDAPLGMLVPWLAVVPVCAIAGIWISQGQRGEHIATESARGWLRKSLAAAVAGIIVARHAVRTRPANGPAIWGGVVYWAGDVLCLWAALRAIGADVTLHGVALAYATAYIAMLLPLPTGGYGAIDAAATFTLTVLGIPLAEAVVGVIVWRFFNFWLPTIPALIELARSRELGRRLARGGPGGDPEAAPPAA